MANKDIDFSDKVLHGVAGMAPLPQYPSLDPIPANTNQEVRFYDTSHWFNITWYESMRELQDTLKHNGIFNFPESTRAYCDAWSNEESIENGLGNPDCCGSVYLLKNATISNMAHEATHMALGILARHGETNMPIVTGDAPPIEEDLCSLVGVVTEIIHDARVLDSSVGI